MLVLIFLWARKSPLDLNWMGQRLDTVWQELAVRNEVGLADNPLKVSWLEGQPQSTVDSGPPGLSKVRSQESPSWACLGFGTLSLHFQALSSQVRIRVE